MGMAFQPVRAFMGQRDDSVQVAISMAPQRFPHHAHRRLGREVVFGAYRAHARQATRRQRQHDIGRVHGGQGNSGLHLA
jgi:hypothetical protein